MSAADACFDRPPGFDVRLVRADYVHDPDDEFQVKPGSVYSVHEFGVVIPYNAIDDPFDLIGEINERHRAVEQRYWDQRAWAAINSARDRLEHDARMRMSASFTCPACGLDHEYGASCSSSLLEPVEDATTAPCPASPVGQSHPTSCVLCKGSGRVEAL